MMQRANFRTLVVASLLAFSSALYASTVNVNVGGSSGSEYYVIIYRKDYKGNVYAVASQRGKLTGTSPTGSVRQFSFQDVPSNNYYWAEVLQTATNRWIRTSTVEAKVWYGTYTLTASFGL